MQRVATELHQALAHHQRVDLSSLILRSTWRWTHVKTGPFLAKAAWQIAQLAERREIDAVLFSSMVTASLAVPLRYRLARNGVVTAAIVHGLDVTLPVAPYQHFVPHVFNALDAVLPVSRATGDACLVRGLDEEKLHVVPNGVDLSRFRPLVEQTTMRHELLEALNGAAGPLPERGLVLSSVGRQVERKGFAWFIDQVMPLLPADVHYLLAGEGPESENIRAAIQRRSLQDRVRLLGRISDGQLEKLYRGADLFVMPNVPVPGDMEGFGVVMLEAGLCGLPAVAARLEGIRDVITEGRNGHLVESGNAWGFSESIMRYHHDRHALQAAAHRAADHTANTFGWPAVADRYVRVMQALVLEGIPAPASLSVREVPA